MEITKLHSLVRVDHAGESGAKWIYSAQLRWVKNPETKKVLQEMYDQEIKHLLFFEEKMRDMHVRPTILLPLWRWMGGFTGAVSALLGEKAIFGYTEAVEEVIVEHYQKQINDLKKDKTNLEDNEKLIQTLETFKTDEEKHSSFLKEKGYKLSPVERFFKAAVQGGVRFAIKLSQYV
jgi:ubiquinone biosynthesis monooxygenase Coq7